MNECRGQARSFTDGNRKKKAGSSVPTVALESRAVTSSPLPVTVWRRSTDEQADQPCDVHCTHVGRQRGLGPIPAISHTRAGGSVLGTAQSRRRRAEGRDRQGQASGGGV